MSKIRCLLLILLIANIVLESHQLDPELLLPTFNAMLELALRPLVPLSCRSSLTP
jgi:hypothetical protein